MRSRMIAVLALPLLIVACSSKSGSGGGLFSSKPRFTPYEVMDQKQGLVASRLAMPEGWKGTSSVVWNYNDFYLPVHAGARLEAADGGSWIEFFPAEFFLWLDRAHDKGPIGPGKIGGIHHPNITLPEAMIRYVIARNRSNVKNLKILGYRPVNNLPKAFPKAMKNANPKGQGICMRVSYQLNGAPVDEEFYGFMPPTISIFAPDPHFPMTEYHRVLLLAHSLGARSGKLESVRPLLGFVATSIENNPAWEQRVAQVQKVQQDYYAKVSAYNKWEVEYAKQMSAATEARSNQFLAQVDASLAQSRAQQAQPPGFSSDSNQEFYKRADDFDQNLRGTEHMVDQYGQVSDQYTDYNYHWTDGFGSYVHTNDPNFDANKYLPGSYEQMQPAPR